MRSLGHAMDFRETFREILSGTVYILDRARGREPRPDMGARRAAYLEVVFGKGRPTPPLQATHQFKQQALDRKAKDSLKRPLEVRVEESVDVDVGGERQWLGTGDDYAYGLGYARREKSETLGEQIARELQRRKLDLGWLPLALLLFHLLTHNY